MGRGREEGFVWVAGLEGWLCKRPCMGGCAHMSKCVRACLGFRVCVCVYVCARARSFVYACVCVCVRARVCARVRACVDGRARAFACALVDVWRMCAFSTVLPTRDVFASQWPIALALRGPHRCGRHKR